MTDTSCWSLPPLVEGSVYGHLTVTVDEVLWCCKTYPGEVTVLLQWWGDNDSVSLRPGDISKYPESSKDNYSVTYEIHTNLSLFQTYLKQFNKLKLLLINDDTKAVVGHVEVNHLCELVTGIQYQKYFPVITTSGSRIGELRVDFDLIMDLIPEETSIKKVKKRSRRKNKTSNNSFRSADIEDKSKQIKKVCKTCSDMPSSISTVNKLNLELPMRTGSQAPPNTERSDSGESVLLHVIEKGKQLRDAMVLSVLEDTPIDLDEKLLLKPIHLVKDNSSNYKPLNFQRNGEIITSCEEKLINDYLDGKVMKEEDEILVLNTLHADNKEFKPETKESVDTNQKQAVCCLLSKDSCSHSGYEHKSETVNDNASNLTQASSCFVPEDECNALMKRVNCFRLTVDSLTLSSAGWKKINQVTGNKNKNLTQGAEGVPPPGATYFVECHFIEDSPRTQAQSWKTAPLRFCSRRQIDEVVYFGQSSAHALRPPHSASSARRELSSANCLVCWRHLHQRVPALLGHFSLAGVLPAGCLETTVSVPVTTGEPPTAVTVAHLRLTLQLGRDKIYFGQALLEDKQNKVTPQFSRDHQNIIAGRFPMDVKSSSSVGNRKVNHIEAEKLATKTAVNGSVTALSHDENTATYNVPVCANCSKNIITPIDSLNTLLCVICYNLLCSHQRIAEQNLNFTIPGNLETKEVRHHEFIIGLDTVIGFPLFSTITEELSCYLDYKFPQITSGLKAELHHHETTSRVVGVTIQPLLSSVHRHTLSLPVALPLSPLLAACSPSLTLRLWLRYYKPTPRDHMVAMALLPMDELCLMELEFDEQQQQQHRQQGPITRVLELPLALVPSSVTTAYKQQTNQGVLRLTVSYSNHIKGETNVRSINTLPSSDISKNRGMTLPTSIPPNEPRASDNVDMTLPTIAPQPTRGEARPIEELLSQIAAQSVRMTEGDYRTDKNRFWTGPFGKERHENHNEKLKKNEAVKREANKSVITSLDPLSNIFVKETEVIQQSSLPVMKEDFDILAESLEQKFNQLQSDLIKERQRGFTEVDKVVMGTKKLIDPIHEEVNDDLLSFHSLSSNSTMDRLPFILGPPADFRDNQNTMDVSKNKAPLSDTQSEKSVNTISGFLKEEKNVANLGSNESFDKEESKLEVIKPTTFKARIKVDRAVNLKAVKGASNGKKGKVPPTTWVSFGTGDCCERNCGSGGLVCTGQRFMTPVVRRNYNPVWNLAWDIDLPIDYLKQVNKRLVFRVFEENLDVAFGFASANLSILTSGLPCLSSWLSINDLAGACKGQIKIVVTPLEDVSKYQECTIFDNEEDEFEELKDDNPEQFPSPRSNKESISFVASEGEVFVQDASGSATSLDREVEQLMSSESRDDDDQGEDHFSADDIISDYKNTLENNFRNEMAGLENLIKFLRVGSMSNELSFLRLNENKENLSSNPSLQHHITDNRTVPPVDTGGKLLTDRSASDGNTEAPTPSMQKEKVLIDASTETVEKEKVPSSSMQTSSDNVLSKLLQQISLFQLPTVKITDSTSQTVVPETKESCTETNHESPITVEESRTVHMKDVFTETNDICNKRSAQPTSISHENQVSHPALCSELGSALLQHFLTCRPAAVKVADSATQTVSADKPSTANSSGLFTRSQPSGMSSEVFKDSLAGPTSLPAVPGEWITSEEAHSNSERLITIDNNIKDLERFLKENLKMVDRENLPSIDSKEVSSCGSLNSIMDTVQPIVKESSQSSSDLECLGSLGYSPEPFIPRETPDGGNPSSVPDRQNQSIGDDTGTTMKRRGTFVIDKNQDHPADLDVD